MKKNKLLAGLLALTLVVGMAVPVFATASAPPAPETPTPSTTEGTVTETKTEVAKVPEPAVAPAASSKVEVSTYVDLAAKAKDETVTEITITDDITGDGTEVLSLARNNPLIIKGAADKKPVLDFAIWTGGEGIIGTDKCDLTIKDITFKPTDTAKLSDDKIGYHFLYLYGKTNVSGCVFDSTEIKTASQKLVGILSWGKTISITGNTFKINNIVATDAAKNNYGIYYFPCAGQTANISGNNFTGMTGKHIDIGLDSTGVASGLDKVKAIGSNTWSNDASYKLNVYINDAARDLDSSFGTVNSGFRSSSDALAKYADALNKTGASVIIVDKSSKAELYTKDTKRYCVADGKSADYLGKANENWSPINDTDWNADSSYGKVSYANGRTTLTAATTASDTFYYAPYTTFGRGKENYSFGDGFETSVTLDMKEDALKNTRLYWETGINGNSADATRNDSIWTALDKDTNGKIKIINGYHDTEDEYAESPVEGELDSAKPITVKTKVEPVGNTVKATVTVSDGATTLTSSYTIVGAPTIYGSARYGWVFFNTASKTVDVSNVTYRDLTVAPPPPPQPQPDNRPSYSGGGSSTPTSTPSTDLSTIISNSAVSANTPKGTEVEVPSSIADPTFDTKEVAVNAPEAKEFVNTAANAGFAFAKVFQMNLFDGTTKVTKVSDGRVKIALPFEGKAGYDYIVLRYETNGGITAMPALYKDGQITFTTDHFSLYAIAVASTNKNLFADTTVKPTTPATGATSVPQTGVYGLTKLF